MTEIFREIDEALTYDRLMAWWRRYRILAIAALVVALSVGLGWQLWQQARDKRLLQSGERFFELLAKTKPATATKEVPIDNLEGGHELLAGYKILWAFKRAQILSGQKQWQLAHDTLEEVVAEQSNDKLYRNYARLWQASNSIKQGKLEDALRLLSPLTLSNGSKDDASLRALALYLKASIILAEGGRVVEAQEDLENALSLGTIAPELRTKIEQAQTALGLSAEK